MQVVVAHIKSNIERLVAPLHETASLVSSNMAGMLQDLPTGH